MPDANAYKGTSGEIIKDGTTLAFVSSFSVEEAPNLDPVYEMGSRTPTDWKKGNKEITGSFDKMYWNADWLDDIDTDSVPTYKFEGIVHTDTGALTITLSEVTLSGWSLDMPEDDFITESIDFSASNLSTS